METARFHGVRDLVLAATDDVFAERVRIVFYEAGAVDLARPLVEIDAILRVEASSTSDVSGGRRQDARSRVSAGSGKLHINRATYSGQMPRKGDKVKALAREGGPWFEVLAVDDRSHTRLVLQLGEA